jgi:16S rRNA (adenine(1408)-N(1))-methyltransferase
VIVDLGTGDGRGVLARAAAEPRTLVVGIDANAAAMAESSRRAWRGHGSGRHANTLFLVGAAETLPGPLAAVASVVTVVMPWGSLLRGVLGLDDAVVRGAASIVAPRCRVEILVSVTPADGVPGLASLDRDAEAAVAAAWATVGFELRSMRPATIDDIRRARSSWARRLGDRPVWRIELARVAPPGHPDPPAGSA